MTPPVIDNTRARRLFLDRHALIEPPTGPAKSDDLLGLITRLGFVQVDSVNTVERAHHMILWSRRQSYRPDNLRRPLERDRTLFEHWTHDASVIPTAFFPHWKFGFARKADRLRDAFTGWQGAEFLSKLDDVVARIRDTGPVGTGEVGEDEDRGPPGWWNWHPSKTALDYLWRTGVLSVCHRRGFSKVYDLTERVIPGHHAAPSHAPEHTIDWACNAALDRLGFATSGEVAAFWKLVSPDEAKDWCARELREGRIEEIAVGCADGSRRKCFARPGLSAEDVADPSDRVRILSPFDPALRDRNRAERLFGFFYRIEIFVPEPQRRYGYYVFPVLEGDRIIGRIDMKCRRGDGTLAVTAFWPEAGIRMGRGRMDRLIAELERVGRFTDCPRLDLAPGWLREPS